MSADVYAWLLIGGLAVVALFARGVFILPGSRMQMPPTIERMLRYAPAAALVAIIVPDLFRIDGTVTLTVVNPRVVAGAVAFVVAAATRNIILTIVCGMAVLVLARLALG